MINKNAIMILKKLDKHNISEMEICNSHKVYGEYLKTVDYLLNKEAIHKYTHSDTLVTDEVWFTISPIGRDILLEHKHQFIDKWFTRITAIVALGMSVYNFIINLVNT